MYGLIKKDLLMIKQNLKIFMLMFIVFLGLTMVNESDMTFMLPFMSVVISISTFSYDNFNKWDAYAATLPNGRKNVVRAKYVSTIVFVVLSFLVSILSLFIMNKAGLNIDLHEAIGELMICLIAVFLIIVIMFPLLYKLGVEKGRIAIFLITFIVTSLAVVISNNIKITLPSNVVDFFQNYYKILIPFFSILFIFISYKISERIYLKKEL